MYMSLTSKSAAMMAKGKKNNPERTRGRNLTRNQTLPVGELTSV